MNGIQKRDLWEDEYEQLLVKTHKTKTNLRWLLVLENAHPDGCSLATRLSTGVIAPGRDRCVSTSFLLDVGGLSLGRIMIIGFETNVYNIIPSWSEVRRTRVVTTHFSRIPLICFKACGCHVIMIVIVYEVKSVMSEGRQWAMSPSLLRLSARVMIKSQVKQCTCESK